MNWINQDYSRLIRIAPKPRENHPQKTKTKKRSKKPKKQDLATSPGVRVVVAIFFVKHIFSILFGLD